MLLFLSKSDIYKNYTINGNYRPILHGCHSVTRFWKDKRLLVNSCPGKVGKRQSQTGGVKRLDSKAITAH